MNIKQPVALVTGASSGSHTQPKAPGFWRQLALAVEPLGGSHAESLKRRVARLEAEVARLSASAPKPQ